MSLEDRKAEIRREIARKARYLESLEAMPDFAELRDGTVLALTVTYGGSAPYAVVAYRGGDAWYLTGAKSPNGISSDALAEWLMSQGRHLRAAVVLGEFTIEEVPVFDIGEAMAAAMRENPAWSRRRFSVADTYDEASGRGL